MRKHKNDKKRRNKMSESKYYKQIKLSFSSVTNVRIALAKKWATENKKHVSNWPGYAMVKNYLK